MTDEVLESHAGPEREPRPKRRPRVGIRSRSRLASGIACLLVAIAGGAVARTQHWNASSTYPRAGVLTKASLLTDNDLPGSRKLYAQPSVGAAITLGVLGTCAEIAAPIGDAVLRTEDAFTDAPDLGVELEDRHGDVYELVGNDTAGAADVVRAIDSLIRSCAQDPARPRSQVLTRLDSTDYPSLAAVVGFSSLSDVTTIDQAMVFAPMGRGFVLALVTGDRAADRRSRDALFGTMLRKARTSLTRDKASPGAAKANAEADRLDRLITPTVTGVVSIPDLTPGSLDLPADAGLDYLGGVGRRFAHGTTLVTITVEESTTAGDARRRVIGDCSNEGFDVPDVAGAIGCQLVPYRDTGSSAGGGTCVVSFVRGHYTLSIGASSTTVDPRDVARAAALEESRFVEGRVAP